MPEQIVNQGFLYANGCNFTVTSTTTGSMSAGQVRDSTNVFDIVVPAGLTINGAVNGLGGLDTGALTANTVYAVYIMASSSGPFPGGFFPVSCMLSANFTQPGYIANYDIFRRVDVVVTNSSNNFINLIQSGNTNTRTYFYDDVLSNLQIFTGGGSTSPVDINLTGLVPPTATSVYLDAVFTPNVVGNKLNMYAKGSPGASNPPIQYYGLVAGHPQADRFNMNIGTGNKVTYFTTSASDALVLNVNGFVESI